jgi:hypothetical protein
MKDDVDSFIDKQYLPVGVKFGEPSKMVQAEVREVINHWRDRKLAKEIPFQFSGFLAKDDTKDSSRTSRRLSAEAGPSKHVKTKGKKRAISEDDTTDDEVDTAPDEGKRARHRRVPTPKARTQPKTPSPTPTPSPSPSPSPTPTPTPPPPTPTPTPTRASASAQRPDPSPTPAPTRHQLQPKLVRKSIRTRRHRQLPESDDENGFDTPPNIPAPSTAQKLKLNDTRRPKLDRLGNNAVMFGKEFGGEGETVVLDEPHRNKGKGKAKAVSETSSDEESFMQWDQQSDGEGEHDFSLVGGPTSMARHPSMFLSKFYNPMYF